MGRSYAGVTVKDYHIVDTGDIVYTKSPLKKNPFGIIKENKGKPGIVSTLYAVYRPTELTYPPFLNHYFSSDYNLNSYLQPLVKKGAKNDMKVNNAYVLSGEIFAPKIEEQRKIADFLTSLDEVITAEAQKLDTLKAHKKGLMQELFPAEGKMVPKRRFPEFRDSGEWQSKKIMEFAKITTGAKDTQNKVENGAYPFFVRSQNIERIDSYSYDGEAILTSGDGVGVGKNFHYINGKFDFHQRVYCIYSFAKNIIGKFVFFYFSEHFNQRVMQLSAKNSVDSVRMPMIADMPVQLPPQEKEQQKIADCLTSLDELIAAQAEKIEALKAQKKGLMQGLFPVVDTVG